MSKGIIYCAHCLVTGKKYIGQTKQKLKKRIERHFYDTKIYKYKFQNALIKYGEDKFIWGIIEECSYDLLNEREFYWIDYFDSYCSGYNSTHGGDGGLVTHCRKYELMSPDGKIYIGNNVEKFCRENKLSSSEISSVLNGKAKSHKGWKLPNTKDIGIEARIKTKSKEYKLISPNGEIIYGKNRAEFCRKNNLFPGNFSQLLSGKLKSYKGWRVA